MEIIRVLLKQLVYLTLSVIYGIGVHRITGSPDSAKFSALYFLIGSMMTRLSFIEETLKKNQQK